MTLPSHLKRQLIKSLKQVSPDVVVICVTLSLNSQVVEVHVVPADDSGQKLVVGDVLMKCRHDFATLLVKNLVAPMRVHPLNI